MKVVVVRQSTIRAAAGEGAPLKENEFRISDVPPGSVLLMGEVAVFSVEGRFCATQAKCTHRQGPLSEGTLDGSTVTCPWHRSQLNVCTGAAVNGPAEDPRDLPCNRRRRSRACRRSARAGCRRLVTW
jgi:nitrite reductase/ring-hydroxylating ferredoxin subunit